MITSHKIHSYVNEQITRNFPYIWGTFWQSEFANLLLSVKQRIIV